MNKMNPKLAGKESEQKIPTDLLKAFSAAPEVEAVWKGLTPIARRDFISWIAGAKQLETRKRRIEKLGSMLLAGKRRPCCYAVVPMNLYKALAATPKASGGWKNLTPAARRDFISWIDEAKDQGERALRIEKACVLLANGKLRP